MNSKSGKSRERFSSTCTEHQVTQAINLVRNLDHSKHRNLRIGDAYSALWIHFTVHTHIKISVNRAKYQLYGLCVTEIHPCRQRDPSGPGAQGCNPENQEETRTPVAAWGPLFPVIPIVPIPQWRMGCKHQERLKLQNLRNRRDQNFQTFFRTWHIPRTGSIDMDR